MMNPLFRMALAFLLSLACGLASTRLIAQQKTTTSEKLGFASDAKFLIIHADDLALAHSVDVASFSALESKAISCGSIMVPCPWLTEVADYCNSHPDADLGLHLTFTSEWKLYKWGPLSGPKEVPGLIDPRAYLWPEVASVVKHATPAEVETELRAQIDRALSAGIRPTHLDSHMGVLFTPPFFPVYVRLAREYRIPYMAVRMPGAPASMLSLIRDDEIVPDAVVMAYEGIRPEQWQDFYEGLIKNLKPGLTEMIVHLGMDDSELKAVTIDHPAFGSAWRRRDFDVVTSPAFKKTLADNNVTLIGWKEIQKAWYKDTGR